MNIGLKGECVQQATNKMTTEKRGANQHLQMQNSKSITRIIIKSQKIFYVACNECFL